MRVARDLATLTKLRVVAQKYSRLGRSDGKGRAKCSGEQFDTGSQDDRLRYDQRGLCDGRGRAPLYHEDFQGVVHNQARYYCIAEHRERLRPRQGTKSRKTHARQDSPRERIRHQCRMRALLGIVDQNARRSRADITENTAK